MPRMKVLGLATMAWGIFVCVYGAEPHLAKATSPEVLTKHQSDNKVLSSSPGAAGRLEDDLVFASSFETPPLVKEHWVIEDAPASYDFACNQPVLWHVIPVHIDDNGLIDVLVYYWCPAESDGEFDDQPTENAVVAWFNQGNGSFELANEQVFGTKHVQIGGLARKYVRGDINGDGQDDFAFAMNWEDGRSTQDQSTVGAYPSVLLSSPNNTYEVVQLGVRAWGHSVGILPNSEGTKDVVFVGFGDPGLQAFRWSNGSWLDIASSFPSVSAQWATGFEVLPSADPKSPENVRIIGTFAENDKTGAHLLQREGATWTQLDKYLLEVLFQVEMITWTGDPSMTDVMEINGVRYLGAAFEEFCFLESLSEGGNPSIIGKLSAMTTKSGDPIEEGGTYEQGPAVNILVFFEMLNNTLAPLESPIVDEKIDTTYFFYDCKELTANSHPDIAVYHYGKRPLVYLNDGTPQFHQANLDAVQPHPIAEGQSLFEDMNNDGVEDLLLLGTSGGMDDMGNIEIRIFERPLHLDFEG